MERERVLAFRFARHGLDARRRDSLAAAASCPASDFQRGAALLALAARADGVTRAAYDRATDAGELVIAPSLRAAIHALAPADFARYGRGLIATEDAELGEQLGTVVHTALVREGIAPRAALEEVAEAIAGVLAGTSGMTKDELHAGLRERVRRALLPWCAGCSSHHVAPMLWRYAGVLAGMRCDARRRFVLADPRDPGDPPGTGEAVRGFLRAYGPATPKEFAAWAGVARTHAARAWDGIAAELAEVRLDGRRTWLLAEDEPALASPPEAQGVRLLPPRDPYLQHPDRTALAPDPAVRKRLFRPVAGPGAVLSDGRLAGLWRARARGKRAEIAVEALGGIDRDAVEAEAARVAELRGADGALVIWA